MLSSLSDTTLSNDFRAFCPSTSNKIVILLTHNLKVPLYASATDKLASGRMRDNRAGLKEPTNACPVCNRDSSALVCISIHDDF